MAIGKDIFLAPKELFQITHIARLIVDGLLGFSNTTWKDALLQEGKPSALLEIRRREPKLEIMVGNVLKDPKESQYLYLSNMEGVTQEDLAGYIVDLVLMSVVMRSSRHYYVEKMRSTPEIGESFWEVVFEP